MRIGNLGSPPFSWGVGGGEAGAIVCIVRGALSVPKRVQGTHEGLPWHLKQQKSDSSTKAGGRCHHFRRIQDATVICIKLDKDLGKLVNASAVCSDLQPLHLAWIPSAYTMHVVSHPHV